MNNEELNSIFSYINFMNSQDTSNLCLVNISNNTKFIEKENIPAYLFQRSDFDFKSIDKITNYCSYINQIIPGTFSKTFNLFNNLKNKKIVSKSIPGIEFYRKYTISKIKKSCIKKDLIKSLRHNISKKVCDIIFQKNSRNVNFQISEWDKKDNLIVCENKIYFDFFLNCKINKRAFNNASVVIIDGVVEKVSDINKLIEESITNKRDLCIIARNFTEEVVKTISHNNLLGNFSICLLQTLNDEKVIGDMMDFSCLVDSDIVSIAKGDVTSCLRDDHIGKIKNLRIEQGDKRISISPKVSTVEKLRERLQFQLDEKGLHQIVRDNIKSRISRISSEKVSIMISKNCLHRDIILSEIDFMLTVFSSIMSDYQIDIKCLSSYYDKNRLMTLDAYIFKEIINSSRTPRYLSMNKIIQVNKIFLELYETYHSSSGHQEL